MFATRYLYFPAEVESGLHNLPQHPSKSRRPILFVGNHQTYAFDLGILIDQVYRETGIFMRVRASTLGL